MSDLYRTEYMLMLEKTLLIDCCELRKQQIEREGWQTEVLISGENLATWQRHCGIKPCLRGYDYAEMV